MRGAVRGAGMFREARAEGHIFGGDNFRGKLRESEGPLADVVEGGADGGRERDIFLGAEAKVAATNSAEFAKRSDVGANHAATGEQGFSDGQSESLNAGGGEEQLTIPIAPLQFRLGDTAQKQDVRS